MSMLSRRVLRAPLVSAGALALAAATVALTPAAADTPHSAVVSENPANYTPALVQVTGQPKPIADAIAVSGNTVAVGGRFTRLTQNGETYNHQNLVLFDATRVRATSSYVDPFTLAEGFDVVIVNGQVAREEGKLQPGRYGRVLRAGRR